MFSPQPIKPLPGQESVWDYPRPPKVEASPKRIQIWFNEIMIVDSQQTQRVLETSHPPAYYIPPADIAMQYLSTISRQSYCEWKGMARYYCIQVGNKRAEQAAWYYPEPNAYFAVLKDYVAFYPSRMDACLVDGEKVTAQPGDFYGGWITADIVGPFKGESGTWGW
jgi:uncharacterized protein (DUF427 family)